MTKILNQCIKQRFDTEDKEKLESTLLSLLPSSHFNCFITMGVDRLRNIGKYYYVDVIYDEEYFVQPLARNLFATDNRDSALIAERYYNKQLVQLQQEELNLELDKKESVQWKF